MAKFVFITGGVVSSIGKGIVAASLGRLLKSRGYNVSILKLDPYLNVDPGTMSPFQHGEVFVTEDGADGWLIALPRLRGPAYCPLCCASIRPQAHVQLQL